MAAVLLFLLFFIPRAAPCDIYSWVDANGVRHYSNTQTDGDGDQTRSSPEFNLSKEEEERIQREAAEKAARGTDQSRDSARSKSQEEKPSNKSIGDPRAQQEKDDAQSSEELQARCKKAKERLSELRFTSFHKYENPEVEKYALEWAGRHLRNDQADDKADWRRARDEDVQKYKKFKYEQELKQAEKEVEQYCRN
jgi:hypothetical protein